MATQSVLNNAQILVIDDEPDLRTLYELTLLREGYDVESAGSVEEAWALLTQRGVGGYQLVITDMRLPDGTGLDLLRRMRAQGVDVTVRRLRRRRKRVWLDNGTQIEGAVFEEKGIDVRIALDVVRTVLEGSCDVILLFSQDQDFV